MPIAFFLNDADPAAVFVVPGDPDSARSPSGTPMVTLVVADDTALLSLGTIWWPGEWELTAGLDRVAQALGRSPSELRVSGSAVSALAVTVWVRAADGSEHELGGTTPSGTPPFPAALSLAVPATYLDPVRRACLGEGGLLSVRLSGELVQGHTATTVLIAESGGEVTRHRVHLPGCDPEVIAAADRLAEDRLAKARSDGAPPLGILRVSATVRHPSALPLTRAADVGDWVRGSRERHVVEYHRPVEEPVPAPVQTSVSVDFDAAQAPVERIEVRSGEAVTVLLPPFDRPAELAGRGELTATTFYLAGGSAHRCAVRMGEAGWTLTPADLGLAEVRVDATALRDRGATRVTAVVHYQPSGEGTTERRTIELGSGRWSTSWHVVSRAPDLDGELLVTGLEVTPPGIEVPSFLQSTTSDIFL